MSSDFASLNSPPNAGDRTTGPIDQLTSTNLSAFRDSTSPDASSSQSKATTTRIRRRNRLITSCLECRRRKLKCDKLAPCTNCTRFQRDCLYLAPSLDPRSQQKLADIKERMGALERNLEREVVGQVKKPTPAGARVRIATPDQQAQQEDDDSEEDVAPDEEETLEPTPLAALDNVYEDTGDDEVMDLGVQMGKMRISERIGGWIRPKLVEELNDTLADVQGGKSKWSSPQASTDQRPLSIDNRVKIQASPKSYIGPGPDYIAPASSFFFPGTNMSTSLVDYLPSKQVADQLISQYWRAVHYMCKIVHRPTFTAQYTLFWGQIAAGSEPMPPVQAVIFAAMFTAAVSMTDTQVAQSLGASRAAMVDSLRSGTEMALSKANMLRTTRVDTMQAFVMYLIPLVRAEVSRAHSALVGTAIRLAECMGLHRDGSLYGMSPIETHVRRMIWHQLCFLDMRTCEATGPRPQIRKEDYDTRFPLNVNDADLVGPNPPKEDAPHWTDMTLTRIRMEAIEMRRQLFFDTMLLDKKKKTLTSVLVKLQKMRTALESKYIPMMDMAIPFHVAAKHILALGVNGLFVQILHRYLFSTTTKMPDRLRQLLIESGLGQMENAIELETNPDLAPWTWYKGAFNQFHSALLLMVEVYAFPMRRDAARIWKCLDYVFDIPSHLSPKQKAELVITDLRDRMEIFHQMRKIRSTTQLEQRVGSMSKSSFRDGEGNLVDATGQMPRAPGNMAANYSPPQPQLEVPAIRSGQPNTMSSLGDIHMTLEDIDWNEWDKWFSPETNTGDLNVPDFDFATYTGGFNNGPGMTARPAYGTPTPRANEAARDDMADVNFTSTTMFPVPNYRNSQTTRRNEG